MKKGLILFFLGTMISFSGAYAADQAEHVVERGETLQSIARTYQVTEESLLEANPMAREMFYAGMVLVIPEASDSPDESHHSLIVKNTTSEATNPKNCNNVAKTDKTDKIRNTPSEDSVNSSVENGIEDFGGWYLYYSAAFDSFEHGYYGVGWRTYNSGGFGATLSLNANYGLGDGNVLLKFGPVYGYKVIDWLAVNAALRGFIKSYDKVDKINLNTGKATTSFAVTGGITLTPGFEFKVGKLLLGFGYELGWCHGLSGLYHNAEFAIGIHI